MKKRLLSLFCTFALLAGLLPGTALAADHWAADAVNKLNGIYGSGGSDPFSADDATMTTSDLNALITFTGWQTNKAGSDSSTQLSRSTACEVLADVFDLPIGTQSAIQYLYEKNIINGVSENNLNETGNVSKAEFAVLTYRVLNSVGGGMGAAVAGLKPGTPEYMAWMYLAVRKCVPFVEGESGTPINVNQAIGTATGIETYMSSALKPNYTDIYDVSTEPKDGKAIWDAWEDALGDTNIGGIENFAATEYYDEDDTLLEAATKIVGQFMDQKNADKVIIFHDVTPDNWFYDGIMYLANQNIVIGYGDGQFGPNDTTPNFQFAILLSIMDGTVSSTDTSPDRIATAIAHVRKVGYLDIPESANDESHFNDPYWSQPTTREEATVGILRMIEETTKNEQSPIVPTNNNLTILDRFTDADDIANETSKPYLAYAVSIGLLSGTSENTLDPDGSVSRAQVGVLLYRTLIGLDTSKMHDYGQNVQNALGTGITSTEP